MRTTLVPAELNELEQKPWKQRPNTLLALGRGRTHTYLPP